MNKFSVTSTITISAESKEKADEILREEQKELSDSPMGRELLRNAEVEEL